MKKFAPKNSLVAIAASALALEYDAAVPSPSPYLLEGAAAVVSIRGPLVQRLDCYFDSYEAIDERVDAALASSSSVLLLDIDSPGGEVSGAFELAEHIRLAAGLAGKRVVAFVSGMACSAAYALACSADAIFAQPSALVGSIGVAKMLCDTTAADRAQGLAMYAITSGARKADGNVHVPMSEATLAASQHEVDMSAELFFSLVSSARGIPSERIAALQAGVFLASEAAEKKLIDGVFSYATVLAMVANGESSAPMGGDQTIMTPRDAALAALRALAESDSAEDKKYAAEALALFEPKDGEEPDEDDKPKAESKDSEEPDEDDKPAAAEHTEPDEDDKPKEEAKKSSAKAVTVASLAARIDARERAEERAKLLASRPDFTAETRKFLERQPLSTLRDAVKSLPKIAAVSKSTVKDAIAALDVSATRGEGHSAGDGITNLSGNAELLDAAMGGVRVKDPIRFDRTVMSVAAMTRSEARAYLAAQAKKDGALK